MFRLDQELGRHRTRVTISGEVSSACIEPLETCCDHALKDGREVHLILDATHIDETGRALLRRLAAKGVRLFAKGIYHSYLVDTIRQAAHFDPNSRFGTTRALPRSDDICRK